MFSGRYIVYYGRGSHAVCSALYTSLSRLTAAMKERGYYSHFSDEEPGSERLSYSPKVTQLGGDSQEPTPVSPPPRLGPFLPHLIHNPGGQEAVGKWHFMSVS